MTATARFWLWGMRASRRLGWGQVMAFCAIRYIKGLGLTVEGVDEVTPTVRSNMRAN
jgi:hypothetical protein